MNYYQLIEDNNEPICGHCGENVQESDKECWNCGERLVCYAEMPGPDAECRAAELGYAEHMGYTAANTAIQAAQVLRRIHGG